MSSTPADRPPLGTLLLIATVCVIVAAWVRASHSNWVAPLEPYVFVFLLFLSLYLLFMASV